MQRDEIHIEQLEVDARIGVPDAEREQPQRLVISLTLIPRSDFTALDDDLAKTIDYTAVAEEVRTFAASHVLKLIETFADRLAVHLLQTLPLAQVSIDVRKFVLPETKHVAVRLTRNSGRL